MRDTRGITLIALVVTIVVLLILAGITIATLTGENGILTKANESKVQYIKAEIKEEIESAIIEIEMQSKEENPQLRVEDTKIIKELPNKLQNIIINDDMTGEYKGYKYWIDENNHVHVGEKENNPIIVQASASYIGTSSCTLTIEASSTQGEIVEYQYKINNEQVKQLIQGNYTIENLEPETQYIISITAIDEKGNQNTSKPITITTKERTYLYKDGEEYVELTGGWKRGPYNIGTFSKDKGNYLNLHADFPADGNQFWNSCQTTNGIDFSEYKKINYKYEIDNMIIENGKYYGWIHMTVCNPSFVNYNSNNVIVGANDIHGLNTDISKQIRIATLDVVDINGIAYPSVLMFKWSSVIYVADIKVYEVWLEK